MCLGKGRSDIRAKLWRKLKPESKILRLCYHLRPRPHCICHRHCHSHPNCHHLGPHPHTYCPHQVKLAAHTFFFILDQW